MTTYKKLLINALSYEVEKEIKKYPSLYGFKHSDMHVLGNNVEILKNQEYDTVNLNCTVFIQEKDEQGNPHYNLKNRNFKLIIIGSSVSVKCDMIGE